MQTKYLYLYVMERVICRRLTWKLEVEGGIASTQNAYRKQKSCVQSLVRLANQISMCLDPHLN